MTQQMNNTGLILPFFFLHMIIAVKKKSNTLILIVMSWCKSKVNKANRYFSSSLRSKSVLDFYHMTDRDMILC